MVIKLAMWLSQVLRLAATPARCYESSMKGGPSVNPELRVLLVYEDWETALHAKRIFDVIAQAGREEVDARLSIWRFDFFHSPEIDGDIMNHSAGADIIILAPRSPDDLPAPVRRWLEIFPEKREAAGGALVAVFPPDAEVCVHSSRAAQMALGAAERAEMDFFLRPGTRGSCHAPAFARESPRMKAVFPAP
jgi:hypothetical protein